MSNDNDAAQSAQYKLLAKILFFVGIVFVCAGFYAVLAPEAVANILSMDEGTAKMVGFAVIFAGFGDFVMGKIFQSKS